MKFRCNCGSIIRDQSDSLKSKAHLITDKDWIPFWDQIEEDCSNQVVEKRDLQIRNQNVFREIYECEVCGRIHLYQEGRELLSYEPVNKEYNKVLS